MERRHSTAKRPFRIVSPIQEWMSIREKELSQSNVKIKFQIKDTISESYSSVFLDHLRPSKGLQEIKKRKDIAKIIANREIIMFKHELEEQFKLNTKLNAKTPTDGSTINLAFA